MSTPLRILLAVDKFKGCLTGGQVASHLRAGLTQTLPRAEVRLHPVSDGGDGFSKELMSHGYVQHTRTVAGPLGSPTDATFAQREGTVVVEMALASGLQLVRPRDRRPLLAHTFGLGQLLADVAATSPDRVIIGAGGSATNDGGAGALAALGAVLHDRRGRPLTSWGPAALRGVHSVDLERLRSWPRIRVEVATDVTNVLLGPQGAAAVFGPQKGASPADVREIEDALTRWADVLEGASGRSGRGTPGAGAAGGLGFGLAVGLGAVGVDGLDTFAELTGLEEAIAWADVVVTGEGSLDGQTTSGKAPSGVLRHARLLGRPCWVVAGRTDLDGRTIRAQGYAGHRELRALASDDESSISLAPTWLRQIGADLGAEMLHAVGAGTRRREGSDVAASGRA